MSDNGTFIKYVDNRFGKAAMQIIGQVNAVIDEFAKQGYSMTVRQIYYQFLSREWMDDWHPPKAGKSSKDRANSVESYNLLKSIIGRGRDAGLISWTAIEDRERPMYGTNWVDGPKEALQKARLDFALDLWHNQPIRPFVLVEKNGQLGIVGRVCNEARVDYASCKGYSSQSAVWRLGRRCRGWISQGQRPIGFHLGDHDPSGIDATRDVRERLSLYAGTPIQIVRLALNKDQVIKYSLPPNYVKMTDSRAEGYIAEHGRDCYEMDAPAPDVTAGWVRDAIAKVRDDALWSEALAEEAADKDYLDQLIEESGQ